MGDFLRIRRSVFGVGAVFLRTLQKHDPFLTSNPPARHQDIFETERNRLPCDRQMCRLCNLTINLAYGHRLCSVSLG